MSVVAPKARVIACNTTTGFGGTRFLLPSVSGGIRPFDFVYRPNSKMYAFWPEDVALRPHVCSFSRGVKVPTKAVANVVDIVAWLASIEAVVGNADDVVGEYRVVLAIDHPYVVNLFGTPLKPFWLDVTLVIVPSRAKPAKSVYVRFSKVPRHGHSLAENASTLRRGLTIGSPAHMAAILAAYKTSVAPTVQILVLLYDVPWTAIRMGPGWRNVKSVSVSPQSVSSAGVLRNRRVEILSGSASTVVAQQSRIQSTFAGQAYCTYVGEPDAAIQFTVHDTQPAIKVWSEAPAVEQHWCTWHHRLRELALALDPLQLPPYVLLEIVDWIGYHQWPELPKIELIINVRASARAVCLSRETGVPSGRPVRSKVEYGARDQWSLTANQWYLLDAKPSLHPAAPSSKRRRSNAARKRRTRARRDDDDDDDSEDDDSESEDDDSESEDDDSESEDDDSESEDDDSESEEDDKNE